MEQTIRSLSGKKILKWFALAAIITVCMVFFTFSGISNLIEQNKWVSHTYEVLGGIDEVLFNLQNILANERAYIITGQERYEIDYKEGLPKIEGYMRKLQFLTIDNSAQQDRIKQLTPIIQIRLERMTNIIAAYKKEGEKSAFDMVRMDETRIEDDEIRNICNAMQNDEKEILAKRTRSANAAMIFTFLVGGVGILVYFTLLSSFFWLSRKESLQREKIQVALNKAAMLVEEKTTETKYVSKIGDFLQSCRNHEEAFPFIADTLARLLPESSGAIAITNNSHDIVEIVSKWGNNVTSREHFSPDDCWALRRGRAHVIDGNGIEPPCAHITNVPAFSMCLPMMAQGVTLGVLYICSDSPKHVDDNKLQILTTVSEQISLALANLRLQETLRMQSIRDPLTQLFNRRYINASLERELSSARRHKYTISMLMIDIDHFKQFNDKYGHEAGDSVLTEVSRMLLRNIRAEDTACRYGGEEFLVIYPRVPIKEAYIKAETLRLAVSQLVVQYHRQSIGPITISIGIAEYPTNGEQSEVVIAAADAALYQAKQRGRNQVVNTEAMVFSNKREIL